MHRPLSHAEVEALNAATPVEAPVMTRAQKLERWATLLEQTSYVYMGDRVEYSPPEVRECMSWHGSPMAVAAADPVFKEAGLTDATYGASRKFFELSDTDIHAVSCNCGGHLTGTDMAARIRGVAARGPF